ncbi:hypothetical protein KAW18_18875 [candidate division WOR-3 bacterium]|nr:hypothetical protein [candidate division WOR-3 bacterium]
MNDKIVKLRNVPDVDTLLTEKLLAHSYLPVSEMAVPAFDGITQSLSDSYEIKVNNVTRKWTVTERLFDEAKMMKEEEIKSKTLDYIRTALASHNNSILSATLEAKNAEFMTALSAAKNNDDLRGIDVKYEKAK